MNTILFFGLTLLAYLVCYIYLVRKYKIYKLAITKVIAVSISSLAIGYIASELSHQFSIHMVILLLLFISSLVIYSIKLVKINNDAGDKLYGIDILYL